MRLFVAIDIEPHIRVRIKQIQNRLAGSLNLSDRQVKWVQPEQIHLTLKFLGEVGDGLLTQVCDAVQRTAADFDAFDFEVRGVGVFGRPARVVWAGVTACEPLKRLQKALDERFVELGWDRDERVFTGHLTVCRVKQAKAGRLLADSVGAYQDEPFGMVGVSDVVIYQSELTSSGPIYTPICRAALKW